MSSIKLKSIQYEPSVSFRGRGKHKFTDEQLFQFITTFFSENDQIPPYGLIAEHFDVALNAVTERILNLEKKGHFERNEIGKIKFSRKSNAPAVGIVSIDCSLNPDHKTRSRLHDIKDSKICDYDMIHYIHKFLTDNDQLPPAHTIATNFCVSKNAVVLRLKRLQKHGVLDRNDVNKLKFNREYLKSIIVA